MVRGVVLAGGDEAKPLSRAIVWLEVELEHGQPRDERTAFPSVVLTDRQGRFECPLGFAVHVELPGQETLMELNGWKAERLAVEVWSPATGRGWSTELAGVDLRRPVDLGRIAVPRVPDLEWIALAPDGAPIEGAFVSPARVREMGGTRSEPASDGRTRLSGARRSRASASGAAARSFPRRCDRARGTVASVAPCPDPTERRGRAPAQRRADGKAPRPDRRRRRRRRVRRRAAAAARRDL